MNSPLKQVNAGPAVHKPKAASLYDQLFTTTNHSPGFWVELFILPLSKPHLQKVLSDLPREEIIAEPIVLRTLFSAGIANLQSGDKFILSNSLQIVSVVLEWLLSQKFASGEVMSAIASLDTIDRVLDDLGRGLNHALELVPGVALDWFFTVLPAANGNAVGTYLTSRNFFRPLINLIDTQYAAQALTLLGLFCLLNKREEHADPYRIRIADFIDEDAIHKALVVLESQINLVSPQSETSWMKWFHKETTRTIDTNRLAILHCVYEFCLHNELFAVQFVRSDAFTAYFEIASLVVQSQHTDAKLRDYSILTLFILRVIVERSLTFNELCETSNERLFRVAQARSPRLVQDLSPRVPLAAVLDILQCCLRFNVRRNMDHLMYNETLTILYQIIHNLRIGHLPRPVSYDWPQLFRTLFSVVHHLSKEETTGDDATANLLCQIFATICLSPNILEIEFLPLLQKVFASEELFKAFSMKFKLSKTAAMAVIHSMIAHYQLLVSQNEHFDLNSENAAQIVKQGQHALNMYDGEKFVGTALPRFTELTRGPFFAHEARTILAAVKVDQEQSSA